MIFKRLIEKIKNKFTPIIIIIPFIKFINTTFICKSTILVFSHPKKIYIKTSVELLFLTY